MSIEYSIQPMNDGWAFCKKMENSPGGWIIIKSGFATKQEAQKYLNQVKGQL